MSYQVHIDWMWGETSPCGRPVCLAFVVWDDPLILRGPLSAKQCVQACIISALPNLQMAINWLCAGQAHNQGAQAEIRAAGPLAVLYAVEKYGPHKGNLEDFITPASTIYQSLEVFVKSSDKNNITFEDLGITKSRKTALQN